MNSPAFDQGVGIVGSVRCRYLEETNKVERALRSIEVRVGPERFDHSRADKVSLDCVSALTVFAIARSILEALRTHTPAVP